MHLRDGLIEPGNVSSKHELGQILDVTTGEEALGRAAKGGGGREGMGRFFWTGSQCCRETSLLRENEICSQEGGGVAADAAVIGHAFAF